MDAMLRFAADGRCFECMDSSGRWVVALDAVPYQTSVRVVADEPESDTQARILDWYTSLRDTGTFRVVDDAEID
jgi:hypothetical protein